MKNKVVEITYRFKIKYGHTDHLKRIIRDLREEPVNDMSGAGIGGDGSDGKIYSYSCERIGKGRQLKKVTHP